MRERFHGKKRQRKLSMDTWMHGKWACTDRGTVIGKHISLTEEYAYQKHILSKKTTNINETNKRCDDLFSAFLPCKPLAPKQNKYGINRKNKTALTKN